MCLCVFFFVGSLGWLVHREGSFPSLSPGAGPGLSDGLRGIGGLVKLDVVGWKSVLSVYTRF